MIKELYIGPEYMKEQVCFEIQDKLEYIREKYQNEVNNEQTRKKILTDIVRLFTPYIDNGLLTKNINVSLVPTDNDDEAELKISITGEPMEVITDIKKDLIKRFEILNMMYQSTDPESINHMPFNEYALKHWDEVDMNYLDNIM